MSLSLILLSFSILPLFSGAIPQQDDWEPPPIKKALIHVNVSKIYQTFDGMGFSEAFQRSKIIYGSDGLSTGNTRRVLDLLFSNTTGAGLTILRNGIGSSVESPYDLMKSIQPLSPGSPSSSPDYTWDGDDNGQVRLTRDAIARGLKTVYADAWSAPGYMKNNSNDSRGGSLCGVRGVNCTSGDWKSAYAEYLVKYLEYYEKEGIHIDHVGFLNEPDLNTTYASMLSTGQQAADFLKVFHPALKASGLNTTIACCDGGGWEEARTQLSGLQGAGAEDTLDIVSAHGYFTHPSTPFNTTKRVWQTEWADLDSPATLSWHNNNSAGEGLTWALNIHNAFINSNVSAFLYWIGAGNTTTNSALILLRKDEVRVSKRLWAFAQWGRFVKTGARRVDAVVVNTPVLSPSFELMSSSSSSSSTSDPGIATSSDIVNLHTSAFLNPDHSISIQVINNSSTALCVNIQGISTEGRVVRRYLTNNEHDLAKISFHPMAQGSCGGDVGGMIERKSMMGFVVSKF